MKNMLLSAATALAVTLPSTAPADSVSAFLYEESGDVILEYFGSIDTAGFTPTGSLSNNITFVIAENGSFGSINGATELFLVDLKASSFGPGFNKNESNTAVGSSFGIDVLFGEILLPQGYVSQSDLEGSGAFGGDTLASLGADVGVYTYETLVNNAVTNTITLTVGSPPPPIPLPATLPLLATGLGGLLLWRRRAAS